MNQAGATGEFIKKSHKITFCANTKTFPKTKNDKAGRGMMKQTDFAET